MSAKKWLLKFSITLSNTWIVDLSVVFFFCFMSIKFDDARITNESSLHRARSWSKIFAISKINKVFHFSNVNFRE